jgi:hypothetical protein
MGCKIAQKKEEVQIAQLAKYRGKSAIKPNNKRPIKSVTKKKGQSRDK